MSDIETLEHEATEVDDATETDGQQEEAAQTDGPSEIEQRARRMGWVPKEEYRGKGKWVDAEAFMEVTQNHMGLRDKELKRTLQELSDLKDTVRKMVEGQNARIQREVQLKVKELEAARDQAVANGDLQAYRQASRDIQDYTEELQEAQPAPEPKPSPAFVAWQAENEWFEKSRRLRAFAEGISVEVMKEAGWDGKTAPTKRMLDAVTAEVRKEFPEEFENPRRRQGSPTEGRTVTAPRASRQKGWDDIPAEDRQQIAASRMIGTHSGAVFKTREDYAKSYWKTFA